MLVGHNLKSQDIDNIAIKEADSKIIIEHQRYLPIVSE